MLKPPGLAAHYRLRVCMWLQFLAFRLSEVKLNCEHLTADLNMTMVSLLIDPQLLHWQQYGSMS